MPDFRCSIASLVDDEPMVGTAPTDAEILLVESPGPWGRDALSRQPPARGRSASTSARADLKVFLLRRPRRQRRSRHPRLPRPRHRDGLRRPRRGARPARGPPAARPRPHVGVRRALWLVCTNGKRDRCCAEIGRPIAGLLAATWPEGTWETTHLGGHRFSGTLLALPSGITLGRLDTDTALDACAAVERGEVPLPWTRGRAGRPALDQVRELHVLAGGDPADELVAVPGPTRRQSCGDDKVKGTTRFEVRETETVGG